MVFYYFCFLSAYYAFQRIIWIIKLLIPFYYHFEEQVKNEIKKSNEKKSIDKDEKESEPDKNEIKCCKNCENNKVSEGKKKR